MAVRWFAVPFDRKRSEWMLTLSFFGLFLSWLSERAVQLLGLLRTTRYDEFAFRFDSYFAQPSFLLGKIVYSHPGLMVLVSVAYGLLAVMMVATVGIYLWFRSEKETIFVAVNFALNLFLALPIYLLCPVSGPAFAFRGFPFAPPHLMTVVGAPNGVPSVHTSSALLVLWFLKRWPWGKACGWVFLALTVLSSLASGQHYLFDLLCAVPYAMTVLWISRLLDKTCVPPSVDAKMMIVNP